MPVESDVRKSINKKIDLLSRRAVHHNPNSAGSFSSNGIPDQYYDGPAGDLWIEYKFRDAMPRNGLVGGVDAKKRGYYKPLQYEWMSRRWRNCVSANVRTNVIGIVGLPNRLVVIQTTPHEWEHGSSISLAVSHQEAAAWVTNFCTSPSFAR